MKNARLDVLVDATAAAEGTGGMATYLEHLIEGFREVEAGVRLTLVGTRALARALRAQDGGDRHVLRMWYPSALSRIALQQFVMPMLALKRRADLIFGAAHVSPLIPTPVPSVVTIHDLGYLHGAADLNAVRRLYGATIHRMSIAQAARVICVSRATLSDVLKIAPKAGDKATVIPPGADHVRRWRRKASRGEYAIAFAHWRHKNPEIAIRAWGQLRRRLPGLSKRLIIVGGGTYYRRELLAEAERAGVSDLVVVLPYVPSVQLGAIFSGASLLIFPSAFEGFGLPVAEAMALRIPVVCSNDEALMELGSDCVLYAGARSPDAFAEQCARIIHDTALRRNLVDAAHARVRTLTWAQTAEATLKVFREAAGLCATPGQR